MLGIILLILQLIDGLLVIRSISHPRFNCECCDGRDVLKAWGRKIHLGLDVNEEPMEGNDVNDQHL